ncbi:hypothetical protein HL658_21460 [Azospirillum sp. RWY-5-1]|uniref:Uncharacterized protein n=1 Tax=Azospirillum oleiclasticum TaxID=2735135 RepID=A0ABX2TJR6_9PROT|nr:hypothetical protein [Azospirillum oleiclasticum]NYZ15117.1 hypothetical protein [Azospirillum oleiclasticum]NYZ22880.1 hypothetical protein [Azospirillum oleiclasticum]
MQAAPYQPTVVAMPATVRLAVALLLCTGLWLAVAWALDWFGGSAP